MTWAAPHLGSRMRKFDLTGVADPFGVLAQHYHVPENEGESEGEDGPIVSQVSIGEGLSMLRRDDYVVVDPEGVIAEGRRSYLKVWPNDTEEDASRDVTDLSRALYQVAHAGGWDEGLRVYNRPPRSLG